MFASQTVRGAVLLLLAGLASASGFASAPPPQATLYGIGDLAGGPVASTVRDAIKVSGTIYAVGGSAARNQVLCVSPNNPPGCVGGIGPDTPTLWTWDGANAVLTPLPNLAANLTANTGMSAAAITPDATFIASQARDVVSGGSRVAVRVTTSGFATENLNVSPYTVFAQPSGAAAISSNGSVLYGSAINRVVRYDIGVGSALVPLLVGTLTGNNLANRGTSADGSVVVGTSFTAPFAGTTNGHAFRYVHGEPGTVVAIPELGSWSRAVAVSPDGNLTLAIGDSPFVARGEVYIHNTATDAITRLGSPNTAWNPTGIAGMTSDGSVVAITFAGQGGARDGYIRNNQGWFHLFSVLAAGGVANLEDWNALQITGMSSDGTLVFGQGQHDGSPEGFVAEFDAGYLAAFDAPPVPPANTSIVGAWRGVDANPDPQAANDTILFFLADGSYFHIEANVAAEELNSADGFERGRYLWDAVSGAFSVTTLQDTNGDIGLSGFNGRSSFSGSIAGDTLTVTDADCVPVPLVDECFYEFSRVAISPGSLVGGWFMGNAGVDDSSAVVVFLDNGTYYLAQDGDNLPPDGDPNGYDGVERGTWTWDSIVGAFSATTIIDTNGQWGLSHPLSPMTTQLSPDQLRAFFTEGPDMFTFNRVTVATVVTPPGTNVVVEPQGSTGTSPVTIEFAEVTGGGETTLQVLDPSAAGSPESPAGFALGDPPLYYEIDTTAVFTGTVTVCFDYSGITFAGGTPRLFHYEGGVWLDITTSVDTVTSTICGDVASFSPFAIFVSPITRTGFYRPVSSDPAMVNKVERGSTVPLKFNVHVGGVEKTDTAGLEFTTESVPCATAPRRRDARGHDRNDHEHGSRNERDDDGPRAPLFRYDFRKDMFIYNWKAPKAAGCYLVRMTTTDDGLSLSALFKVK